MVDSKLDLVVAGTADSVTMVEAAATEVPEAHVLDAIQLGHEAIRKLCALQEEVLNELDIEPGKNTFEAPEKTDEPLIDQVRELAKSNVREAIVQPTKPARKSALEPIGADLVERLGDLEETEEEGKWPVKAVKRAYRDI